MIVTGLPLATWRCRAARPGALGDLCVQRRLHPDSFRAWRGSRSINTGAGASSNSDLGFISDLHGNPCITGKFVTNAPAYLTDLIGLGALGVAGPGLFQAQKRTTYSGMQGSSSTITGGAGGFTPWVRPWPVARASLKWLLRACEEQFRRRITPSGHQLVVHLDGRSRSTGAQRTQAHPSQAGRPAARQRRNTMVLNDVEGAWAPPCPAR